MLSTSLLREYGLLADKRLGQHFLLDQNITDKIARTALAGQTKPVHVLEVGPGPGGLSLSLLRQPQCASLNVIEHDKRFASLLADHQQQSPFTIHWQDALKTDYLAITPAPRYFAANLPYNIAAPILVQLARQAGHWQGVTVLIQKEMAQRMVAQPATKIYGRLSVIMQACFDMHICFDIPPQAFVPPPKVMSSIIQLQPRAAQPALDMLHNLEKITNLAFSARRKKISNALKNTPYVDALEVAKIDPTLRGDQLSTSDFLALSKSSMPST